MLDAFDAADPVKQVAIFLAYGRLPGTIEARAAKPQTVFVKEAAPIDQALNVSAGADVWVRCHRRYQPKRPLLPAEEAI